jgi:asparagine synthase (glutamine-hydrolysing)
MNMHIGFSELSGPNAESSGSQMLHWDGRLDNRGDLRSRLGSEGEASSDAPTDGAALALAAYERWGVEGLGYLVGDWSLVIRDRRRRCLVLAVDFAGVRPLFYGRRSGGVVWSTELDALVDAFEGDAIDDEYALAYLAIGGHPQRTPYPGLAPVPAGRAVSVFAGRIETRSFWAPPLSPQARPGDDRSCEAQLRELFREAVAVRLQTPAPVFAELSGGLDSSSVVCMAQRLIREGAVSASGLSTVSYLHRQSIDYPYICEVEAFCGIEGAHLSTERAPLAAEGAVGRSVPQEWSLPLAAARSLAADRGATTFMTGQNGDLAMGNWFDDSLQVAGHVRRGRLGRALSDSLAWSKVLRVPLGSILLRAVQASLPVAIGSDRLYAIGALGVPRCEDTSLRANALRRTGLDRPDHLFPIDWMQAPPERRKHFRALMLMRELRTLQRPEVMRGLDYTHPFAHRPLVEFTMSLPPEMLCRPGRPRDLMRRALGELWPAGLRTRRSKSLFNIPWIEALRPMAGAMLRTMRCEVVDRGWVDRANLRSRLERLQFGLDCNEPQLRQIILLEFWLRSRAARAHTRDLPRSA